MNTPSDTAATISNILKADTPRGIVYNQACDLGLSVVETLRGLAEIRDVDLAEIQKIQAEAAKLKARLLKHKTQVDRADELAEDILAQERERCGPMTEAGMYKVELGDGRYVSLIVTPSDEVLTTPDAADRLEDKYVKVTRTPRLDLIKASLKMDPELELPGCTLVVKKFGTTPPAAENVQWK